MIDNQESIERSQPCGDPAFHIRWYSELSSIIDIVDLVSDFVFVYPSKLCIIVHRISPSASSFLVVQFLSSKGTSEFPCMPCLPGFPLRQLPELLCAW